MAELQEVATTQSVALNIANKLAENPELLNQFSAFLEHQEERKQKCNKVEAKQIMKDAEIGAKEILKSVAEDLGVNKAVKFANEWNDEDNWNKCAWPAMNADAKTYFEYSCAGQHDKNIKMMFYSKGGKTFVVFDKKPSYAIHKKLTKNKKFDTMQKDGYYVVCNMDAVKFKETFFTENQRNYIYTRKK